MKIRRPLILEAFLFLPYRRREHKIELMQITFELMRIVCVVCDYTMSFVSVKNIMESVLRVLELELWKSVYLQVYA